MDSSSVGFKIPTEGYQDSRHQLQALLAEQGLDSCLMQGHIYKGTEWRLAERGVFDDDWGWKARHYIPFPDTKWRTKVVLVPRSVEARNRWLHARYERVPGLVLDGWCRTCSVLYCNRCEELTHVPDGHGPECEHCGDDLDDDAKEVLQHAQSGTASPSEVERRLQVSLARLANPVVQPIVGPHAFNMINPSQFITISADNPRTLKRGEANVVVLLNEGQKISPWRRCPTWLATRTARNAVPACGFPLTNPTGQWFDCQICGGSGWMRS